jgi:tetratricopeptide (TPR) repeat protein
MRIERDRRPLFRKVRRSHGPLSFLASIGMLAAFAALMLGRASWFAREDADAASPANQPADLLAAAARGDTATLIPAAQAALAARPDDALALTLILQALVNRSYSDLFHEADLALALELSMAALAQRPDSPAIIALHAYALAVNGRTTAAYRHALRAIEADRENAVARVALSLAYNAQGLFQASLREAERAIELAGAAPTTWAIEAREAAATALGNLGRYRESLALIDEALIIDHRRLPLHFQRALYARQIGAADVASVAYFNVLAQDPGNIKARLRMCTQSSTLGEREAAIRYCREATDLAPALAEAWYLLGREFYLSGAFSEARDALAHCTSLQVVQEVPISERRFECWYLQGQAAEILGDCPALLATYSEYQAMAQRADLAQSWVYPPEGPAICQQTTP